MQQQEGEGNEVVDLNVGGVVHLTSRTTLLRYGESLLARMINGHHQLARGADGRIFIDRDGELFKFVLQFLRDGDLDVEFFDNGLKQRLKREAAYFCLPDLEKKLLVSADAARPKDTSSVLLRVRPGFSIDGPDPLGVVPRLPPRPKDLYQQHGEKWDKYVYEVWIPALIRLYGQAGYRVVSVVHNRHQSNMHFLFQK